jgi:aminoglycoside phosphotransferase (APT) family kinase protein
MTSDAQPPSALGMRFSWPDLARPLQAAVEAWLGSPVIAADTQLSGFSPGIAARLRCADGRRAFLKAIGPEPNPTSPAFHRREAEIVAALPPDAPVPKLLWTHDEGEGGWILLLFEDVEGVHPAQPWRDDELDRVLRALEALAVALTPSPLAVRVATDVVAREICGGVAMLARPPPGRDARSLAHLPQLASLEAEAPLAVSGKSLLHFDLRADNLLLTADRVLVVDWPHAAIGAAWVDLVFFAPSVAMQGGPPPEELLRRFAPAADAHPNDITAVVATIAGFFTAHALEPAPPGLPTLRAFQAAQGAVARAWLAERLRR